MAPRVSANPLPAYSLYAVEDSMLWNPDPSVTGYTDAADRNFGGLSSRHIASAMSNKGTFEAVVRFDAVSMVQTLDSTYGEGGWSIESITLHLMTSDNVPGPGIFNAPGTAGQFKVSFMPVDGGWKQGTGYLNQKPGDPVNPGNYGSDGGATYNSVHATLATTPAKDLSTFDFVQHGVLSPADYPNLGSANAAAQSDLFAALMGGEAVSLLIQAADHQVAFNFTSQLYIPKSGGLDPIMYDPTLIVNIVSVPEPATLGLLGLGLWMARVSRRKRSKSSLYS
jgi:hypothetical protein